MKLALFENIDQDIDIKQICF